MTRRVSLTWSPGAAGPLLAAEEDLSWRDGARCAEADPEMWFPGKGGSTANAKRICMRCDARPQCLEFALANFERFGVWGAKSVNERLRILAEREPGVPRCESGWHPLTGANLLPDGGCRMCGEVRSVRAAETRSEAKGLAA